MDRGRAVRIVGHMVRSNREKVHRDFAEAVNMSARELEDWLDTSESNAVGWKGRDGQASESVGHASGRRIVAILRKSPEQLTPDDYAHMRKVVGFIRRHRAQPPVNVYTSRWRYSLMNWGNDPIRDDQASKIAEAANPCGDVTL